MKKISLFLASSPVEIISAFACMNHENIKNAIFIVDKRITDDQKIIFQLEKIIGENSDCVKFVYLDINDQILNKFINFPVKVIRRYKWVCEFKKQINESFRKYLGCQLDELSELVDHLYFNILHDYVRVIIGACYSCERTIFPHGFDNPRIQQIKEFPFLYEKRSLKTSIRSIFRIKKVSGIGEVIVSMGYRLLGKNGTCMPYNGSDHVLTFRSHGEYQSNVFTKITELREVFELIANSDPWRSALMDYSEKMESGAIVLLLSEYNRNPIWEQNNNWLSAHTALVQKVLKETKACTVIIKAHPRSDGEAAKYLMNHLVKMDPDLSVMILPPILSSLPIELIAINLPVYGACSLGSCSLPSDIGIDIVHYTSPRMAEQFDDGWVGRPFWNKYHDTARMLIKESICVSLE